MPPFSRIWTYSSRTSGSAAVDASIRTRSPGTILAECSTRIFAKFATRESDTGFLLLKSTYVQNYNIPACFSFLSASICNFCHLWVFRAERWVILFDHETTPSKHQNGETHRGRRPHSNPA